MLFNCFGCGKSISSKQSSCIYCKNSNAHFIEELSKTREKGIFKNAGGKTNVLKEKYAGTLLSFLLKAKASR